MELLLLILLTVLSIPFADPADMSPAKLNIFGALGGALKKIGQAALPAAVGFLTGGPAGAAVGAAGSLLGGDEGGGGVMPDGTGGTLGKIASVAIPAISAFQAKRQSDRDTSRARALTNQSVGLANQGAEMAQQSFLANAPLREAFRSGALNFSDPTNPFTSAISQAAPAGGGGVPPEAAGMMSAIAEQISQAMKNQSGGSKKPAKRGSSSSSGSRGESERSTRTRSVDENEQRME